MPPPGTIMCTCGWWVSADPQVCKHSGDPDPRAEVLGIGCDGQHRVRSRAEQQVIDHRLVLPCDVGDLGRQREHDVEVAHWQ
jgi:hypothetical protein